MDKLKERFLRYIAMDTKSDEGSESCPSTPGQLALGEKLAAELRELGLEDVRQDEHGYVYATLPGNVETAPIIGFIAHMDTAPDLDGKCVNPQLIENYEGGDIRLNEQYSLKVSEFPFLQDLIGQSLITTDGTTLLGADDKAGIAIIMTAMDYLIQHPEIPRGTIKIGFTPDEEIGRGADLFDVEAFGADFAYTVDGGPEGELEYENFNAASVKIHIQGKNVHPGSAKDIMRNALLIAMEIQSLLPVAERPEHTEGYEGFYLLDELHGTVDEAEIFYIIRDHDREKFEAKKKWLESVVALLNQRYDNGIQLEITDSYYNMKEKIEPHIEIVELAERAMQDVGVTPKIKPVRGGTDGAKLSYMGLPTPNLFTGGYNYHGRFEFISYDTMQKAVEVLVKIAELNTKGKD